MPLGLIDPVETVTPPFFSFRQAWKPRPTAIICVFYSPIAFRSMLSKSLRMTPSRISFTVLPFSDIW